MNNTLDGFIAISAILLILGAIYVLIARIVGDLQAWKRARQRERAAHLALVKNRAKVREDKRQQAEDYDLFCAQQFAKLEAHGFSPEN